MRYAPSHGLEESIMEFPDILKLWYVARVFHRYTAFDQIVLIVSASIVLYLGYRILKTKPSLLGLRKLREVATLFRGLTRLKKLTLVLALPIVAYAACLATILRPPEVAYQIPFFLMTDRQVHHLVTGSDGFQVDFFVHNMSSPPEEVHNVFGNIWISGEYLVTSNIAPSRGKPGGSRVEWDIMIPVFPKESIFSSASAVLRMPSPGAEILVGAQLVSKETDRQQYLWKIGNEKGAPAIVIVESPLHFK